MRTPSRTAISLLALCALTATACSRLGPPIAVMGEKGDVHQLVGVWRGEYHGDESGRTGTIEFVLERDEVLAHGDVVMRMPGGTVINLRIRFVRTEGNTVTGRLEHYKDPQCNCMVETEFVGEIQGSMMVGTFTTRGVDRDLLYRGHWTARKTDTTI